MDKLGETIDNAKVRMRLVRTVDDSSDISLDDFKFDETYSATVKIGIEGRWNITGVIEIGNLKAYLFVKTNAI